MKTGNKEDALRPQAVSMSKCHLLIGRLSSVNAKGQDLDQHIPYPELQSSIQMGG